MVTAAMGINVYYCTEIRREKQEAKAVVYKFKTPVRRSGIKGFIDALFG